MVLYKHKLSVLPFLSVVAFMADIDLQNSCTVSEIFEIRFSFKVIGMNAK